jgi:hypothetical protein
VTTFVALASVFRLVLLLLSVFVTALLSWPRVLAAEEKWILATPSREGSSSSAAAVAPGAGEWERGLPAAAAMIGAEDVVEDSAGRAVRAEPPPLRSRRTLV